MSYKTNPKYRKIQALVGQHSFSLVIPREDIDAIGIRKGDYVKVLRDGEKIVIEKVESDDE